MVNEFRSDLPVAGGVAGINVGGVFRRRALGAMALFRLHPERGKRNLDSAGCSTEGASDKSLVTRVAEGDRRAIALLFARHQQRVYRFVLRLVGNSATAEDLVSEVFLDLWRQAASFEGRARLSTWLLAIARNKAFSAMRRRARSAAR